MVHVDWSDPREIRTFDTLNAVLGFVRSRIPTAVVGNWQACGESLFEQT